MSSAVRRTSVIAATAAIAIAVVQAGTASATSSGLPVPAGAIKHVIIIELENESIGSTFGPRSPATYLNDVLLPKGELLKHYYGVGHVSLDNYLAEVSGQAPNLVTSSDCSGKFKNVTPGKLDKNHAKYPGQVDGQGCVFPASVQTIGNQLDSAYPKTAATDWREYAEDMGNDPARDHGAHDPLGGTDCAHPAQVNGTATDHTGSAQGPNATGGQVKSSTTDQYADRHNPFIYFHSIINNNTVCDHHVVPLGTISKAANGSIGYHGHLAQDLASQSSTPRYAFITPNLCDDGHDGSCAGTNDAGGTTGGLVGADDFLRTWMPLILNSPAYRSGDTLVMITFDEGSDFDFGAGDHEKPGPNSANPGYSPLFNVPEAAHGGETAYQLAGVKGLKPNTPPASPGKMPGGGQIGAVLLNSKWIKAGSVDTTGSYSHYSALRTFEDLLGIKSGGADKHGHLGFAATAHDFGSDVFNKR